MAGPAAPPIPAADVNNLAGPLFLASTLNWFFFGTLVIQVYNYSQSFPNDRKGIKAVVYSVFILDCVQSGLTISTVWDTLVANWGDVSFLFKTPSTGISVVLLGSLIGMIVQMFFAWRIWSLKRGSKIYLGVAGVIVAVAIMQCVAGWVSTFQFFFTLDVTEREKVEIGYKLWLSASLACDILIAIAMVAVLTEARRHTSFRATDTLLNKLVAHAVQTGAITAAAAALELALFIHFPADDKVEVPAFILGKLYSNCLLATLNARRGNYLATYNETGNGADISSLHGTGQSSSYSASAMVRRERETRTKTTTVNIEAVQDISMDDVPMHPKRSDKKFAPYQNTLRNSYDPEAGI